MAKVVLLDAVTHRQLSVKQAYLPQVQDGLGSLVIFPSELNAAHKEFPIFIRKHSDTGQFFLCALLSLKAKHNQFLKENEWQTKYVPLMARRGPFLMTRSASGQQINMCVNMDDPRVGAYGERLFDAQGKPTELAAQYAHILHAIHEGHEATATLLSALSAQNLIESITIKLPQAITDAEMLEGIYSVNAEKLMQLSGEALHQLNASGFLQMAYFVASSASNLMPLISAEQSLR